MWGICEVLWLWYNWHSFDCNISGCFHGVFDATLELRCFVCYDLRCPFSNWSDSCMRCTTDRGCNKFNRLIMVYFIYQLISLKVRLTWQNAGIYNSQSSNAAHSHSAIQCAIWSLANCTWTTYICRCMNMLKILSNNRLNNIHSLPGWWAVTAPTRIMHSKYWSETFASPLGEKKFLHWLNCGQWIFALTALNGSVAIKSIDNRMDLMIQSTSFWSSR